MAADRKTISDDDDPIGQGRRHENHINLHSFRLKVNRLTKETKIRIARDYDKRRRRWLNSFMVSLTQDGKPLPGKQLEFWYVERYQPAYDPWNAKPLAERMKTGGAILKPKTDAAGKARVELPARFNKITDPHLSYQLVARFNVDRSDPDYKPFQSRQLEFYAFAPMPPKLKARTDAK